MFRRTKNNSEKPIVYGDFGKLPDNIVRTIFSFFNHDALKPVALVCHRFNDLIKQPVGSFDIFSLFQKTLMVSDYSKVQSIQTTPFIYVHPTIAKLKSINDNEVVIFAGDNIFYVWNIKTNKQAKLKINDMRWQDLAMTPQGDLITTDIDGSLRVRDTKTWKCKKSFYVRCHSRLIVLDNENLLTADHHDGGIQHWNLQKQTLMNSFSARSQVYSLLQISLTEVAISTKDELVIYDFQKYRTKNVFPQIKAADRLYRYHTDSKDFIIAITENSVLFFNLQTAHVEHVLDIVNNGTALLKDRYLAISTYYPASIEIVDIETMAFVNSIRFPQKPEIRHIASDRNGNIIYATRDSISKINFAKTILAAKLPVTNNNSQKEEVESDNKLRT